MSTANNDNNNTGDENNDNANDANNDGDGDGDDQEHDDGDEMTRRQERELTSRDADDDGSARACGCAARALLMHARAALTDADCATLVDIAQHNTT